MNRHRRIAFVALIAMLSSSLGLFAGEPPKPRRVEVGGRRAEEEAVTASWPRPVLKGGASESERLAALEDLIGKLVERDLFSGSVLAARNGQPLLRKAWGLANRDLAAPNRPDTRFNIGSINKAFTAAAIRLLAKDGRLALSDTIARRLPAYKGAGADRITIEQLLEHRSGMGDIFNERWERTPMSDLRSLADYVPLFASDPLEFEPGARQRYSNAGYVLLGQIVEAVSGKSYYDFVRERVFRPLGMSDTESYEVDQIVPNRAVGYTKQGPAGPFAELRANTFALPAKPSSAGGGSSTVDDLLKFGEGMRSGALGLRAEGGLGIAGGSPGVNAVLEVCPGGLTLAVLSNLDPPSAMYVARNARDLLGCGGD